MLVVDTSAVLAALVGRPIPAGLLERLSADGDLHAPHLIDVELLHAVRRLAITGRIGEDRAADVLTDFGDLTIIRYPHTGLRDRMWELRHNLSVYDAAFVALSEVLGAPLVTCDCAIAAAVGRRGQIELFEG